MSERYWHMADLSKRLMYEDGREIELGKLMIALGEIELCVNGMHASHRLFDAMAFREVGVFCYVELGDHVLDNRLDKVVSDQRRVVGWLEYQYGVAVINRWMKAILDHYLPLWCPNAVDLIERYLSDHPGAEDRPCDQDLIEAGCDITVIDVLTEYVDPADVLKFYANLGRAMTWHAIRDTAFVIVPEADRAKHAQKHNERVLAAHADHIKLILELERLMILALEWAPGYGPHAEVKL